MDKFNLHEWVGSGEKSLLNEDKQFNMLLSEMQSIVEQEDDGFGDLDDLLGGVKSDCAILSDKIIQLYQKHGDKLRQLFVGLNNRYGREGSLPNDVFTRVLKFPVIMKLQRLNYAYNEAGCGDAEDLAKNFFGVDSIYDLRENEGDSALNEGVLKGLIDYVLGKTKVNEESDLEEGNVDELRNPLKNIGKIPQQVKDAIEVLKYYATDATEEERKAIRKMIHKAIFGFDYEDRNKF